MWMPTRSLEREYMDDHDPPPPIVEDVYRFLERINRWLGGHRATLQRFHQLSHSWSPGERIEVLEVAAGGGDFARALVRWGRARGFDIHVTALDISPSALRTARLRQASAPPEVGVRLVCGDVHHPPLRDGGVDYVICALFFHHLTDADVVSTLRTFDRLASRGIVVNDLIRRWRLFAWTCLFTMPFNAVLRRDGPLSVRRAFLPRELERLARSAGLPWLTVKEHFGHRMTLAGERTGTHLPDTGS
jgi:ubiquinone/menaquinone biosynthesis C-methylase UbiE